MGRVKKVGPTRGLGARYGATIRKRYIKVISGLKKAHKCPHCGSESVRRQSVGVWECGKCGLIFAGGSYAPVTKLGIVARRTAKNATPEARMEEEKEE